MKTPLTLRQSRFLVVEQNNAMAVTARCVPILGDNYAWLLKDTETGATAIR